MMKKVVVLVALLMSCFAVSAMAAQGPYLGINAGITMPTDSDIEFDGFKDELSYDPGFGIGAALGYNFGVGRLEAEIGYKSADTDEYTDKYFDESYSVSGDMSVFSVMANGYLDLDASPTVKPYLMAGIGMANVAIDAEDVDDDDTVFAYQVGAGVGFALNNKVTLDLGYRYMGTEDAEIDGADVSYGSHNVLAGIRVQF